jgi:hypothetical protein
MPWLHPSSSSITQLSAFPPNGIGKSPDTQRSASQLRSASQARFHAATGLGLDVLCHFAGVAAAQLLLDAGSAEDAAAPVSHVRQRKSILLRVPLGSELFLGAARTRQT